MKQFCLSLSVILLTWVLPLSASATHVSGDLMLTNITCNGACDGAAKVIASGGVGPYSYLWMPNGKWCCQGLDTISGLCSGGYILVVTDLGDPDPLTNKWDTSFSLIDAPPMAILPPTVVDDDCSPTCVGQVSAFAFGGAAPRTFTWSNGSSNSSISDLCAGTYGLTVTDAHSCTQTVSVIVQEPTPFVILVDSVDSVTCFGGADGRIYARAVPSCGVSTDVCANSSLIKIGTGTATNSGSTFPAPYGNSANSARHQMLFTATELVAAGVQPGTLSSLSMDVEVVGTTLNYANFSIRIGCTSVSDLTGGWETGLIEVLAPRTHHIAEGWNQHAFDVKYFWDGVSNIVVDVCFSNPTATSFGNALTNYTPTTNQSVRYYHDNAGSVCGSANLTGTSVNRPNIRFGNCIPVYSYVWSPAPAVGQLTGQPINLSAQTYTLNVTSVGDGCMASETVVVNQPTEIEPVITLTNAIKCNGVCDAEISVSTTGGQGPYTYAWSNGLPAGTSQINLCAGTYTVSVTDAKNCEVTESIIITEPSSIVTTVAETGTLLCFNDSTITLTASTTGGLAPYSYEWSTGDISPTLIKTGAGTYIVTTTDVNKCSDITKWTVSGPPKLVLNANMTNPISCAGECDASATIVATGGTLRMIFEWPNSITGAAQSNLCQGIYEITVTDGNSCSDSIKVMVDEPAAISIVPNITSHISCLNNCDGEVDLVISGGTAPLVIAWPSGSSSVKESNLCAGSYVVTVTDANNCSATSTVVINDAIPLNVTLTQTAAVSCNGVCDAEVTASVTGGVAPYFVIWPGNDTTNVKDNLCAGQYTVRIVDANGCDTTKKITIREPIILDVNLSVSNAVSCNGICDGNLSISPSGGVLPYTVLWSDGSTGLTLPNVCAGTYTVTVTDASGCFSDASVTLTDPPVMLADIDVVDASCGICDGEASVSNVSGGDGGPYKFAWSNAQSTVTIDNLCPATYTVTVTDGNNCAVILSDKISNIGGPDLATFATVNPTCNGVCNGSSTVTPVGGLAPYTYKWSTGSTQDTEVSLCAGIYDMTITDAFGCVLIVSDTLTEPSLMVNTESINKTKCNGACDADISIVTSGGVAPYVYVWDDGTSGAVRTALCAGSYSVTTTDANNCELISRYTVAQPALISLSVTGADAKCFSVCNGEANVVATGGLAPYDFVWSNGDVGVNALNLCTGSTYDVTATDANGCTQVEQVSISSPAVLVIDNVTVTKPNCGVNDGELEVLVSGGIPGYTYLWNGLTSSNPIKNISAGAYNLDVTDANGCILSSTIPLSNLGTMSVVFNTIDASCTGICVGEATAVVNGGVGVFDYAWSNGETTATISGLCEGEYVVTVTDATGGCLLVDTVSINQQDGSNLTVGSTNNTNCGGVCDGTGDVIVVGALDPVLYVWSNNQFTSSVSGLCAGKYFVTATYGVGCSAQGSIEVIDELPLSVVIDNVVDAKCRNSNDGEVLTIITGGAAPYAYEWTDVNGVVSTDQNIQLVVSGTYYIAVEDQNGCIVLDTAKVGVQSALDVVLENQVICEDVESIVFNPVVTGDDGTVIYQWYDLDGVRIGGSSVFKEKRPNDTTYYVLEIISGGCSATDTAYFAPAKLPDVEAGGNDYIVKGQSITIGGNPTTSWGGSSFVWSPSQYLSNNTVANPEASPIETTVYQVMVTNTLGCVSSDTIEIEVIKELEISSGFSPNGDGDNDYWELDFVNKYPSTMVEVYNRWGDLVFRSDPGYLYPWDGTFNAKDLPIGTYYYVIDLKDGDFPESISGPITIVR